jgi:hypothetical protein
MPLEIRELQINVTVNQQNAASSPGGGTGATGNTNEDDKKALINQCVEQAIEIFNNKKER